MCGEAMCRGMCKIIIIIGEIDMNNVEENKDKFLKAEFFMLAWSAATQQRVEGFTLWSNNCTPKDKSNLKKDIRNKIEQLIQNDYCKNSKINQNKHVENIKKVQNYFIEYENKTKCFAENSYIYNFSTAQKLLNTLLKYWWCIGWLNGNEPPAFPVDRINIKNLNDETCNLLNWTDDKDGEIYQKVISTAEQQLNTEKYKNIAQWELDNWKRR